MDPSRRRTVLIGAVVFVVALVVRLIGITWGLPNEDRWHSLHPDEPVIFAYSQQIEPTQGDFAPGFYNYGTFYLTLLRVTTDMADAYGLGPTANTEEAALMAVGRFHLVGRVLSAIAGAVTVWLVFAILFPHVGTMGSLFGAAALCFAPGHVVHSRFQTVDVVSVCFLAASLYFALRLVREEPWDGKAYTKLALWSGVFAGLSAGTKYTGILALVALFVVVVMERRAVAWRAFGLAVLASVAVFFLVTPGAIVDNAAFLRDFKYEMTHTQTGHGLVFAGTPSGYLVHLTNLSFALGLLVTLFGAVGLMRASWRRHVWAFALLAFAAAYYILIGRAEVKFMRYVFPLLPVLAIGFGWLIARAHVSPKPGLRSLVMFFGILAVGGLDGGGAAMTATSTYWMARADLRDTVGAGLKAIAEEDTTVGLVSDPWFYTPTLYPQVAAGPWTPIERRMEWMAAARQPRVVRYGTGADRFDWDVRLLTELEPDYVVFSSFESGDLGRLNELPSPPSEFKIQLGRAEEFMDTLKTRYQRMKVQGQDGGNLPHDFRYIRPEIQVWKLKDDSQTPSNSTSTTSGSSGAQAPTR